MVFHLDSVISKQKFMYLWLHSMFFFHVGAAHNVKLAAFTSMRRFPSRGVVSHNPNIPTQSPAYLERRNLTTRSLSSANLVSSLKSNTVKKWQGLLKKRKKRTEENATVVEGPRMVFDLLENPKTRLLVQHVLVCDENPSYSDEGWMDRLYKQQQNNHPDLTISLGTEQVLSACTDTVTPQGIVATVKIPNQQNSAHSPSAKEGKAPLYLVLDGVSDPGNVGTLLRSSVATGVTAVVLLPKCCDVWNPKAVRSAMGCSFQVPILSINSFEECLDLLQGGWGVTDFWAATMIDEKGKDDSQSSPKASVEHYNVDWLQGPTALIIGSEGTGLSDEVRSAISDHTVRAVHVPMEEGIESLNAAVCGSVIMFEYMRQCRTRTPVQK